MLLHIIFLSHFSFLSSSLQFQSNWTTFMHLEKSIAQNILFPIVSELNLCKLKCNIVQSFPLFFFSLLFCSFNQNKKAEKRNIGNKFFFNLFLFSLHIYLSSSCSHFGFMISVADIQKVFGFLKFKCATLKFSMIRKCILRTKKKPNK